MTLALTRITCDGELRSRRRFCGSEKFRSVYKMNFDSLMKKNEGCVSNGYIYIGPYVSSG